MLNICTCPSVHQHVLDTLSLSRCQYISEYRKGNIEIKAVTHITSNKVEGCQLVNTLDMLHIVHTKCSVINVDKLLCATS